MERGAVQIRWIARVCLAMPFLALIVARHVSETGIIGVFGLAGLGWGVGIRLARPTAPRTWHIFTAMFVFVCLIGIAAGDELPPVELGVVLALTSGWAIGLGVPTAPRRRTPPAGTDGIPRRPPAGGVERSFSGQVIRDE